MFSLVGSGPAGVSLALLDSQGKTLTTTTSGNGGQFSFANVFPSSYKVVASHPTWSLSNKEQSIQVQFGNTALPQPFVVSGYDITGRISSFGEPSPGVDVFLYSKTDKKIQCAKPASDSGLPTGMHISKVFLLMLSASYLFVFMFPLQGRTDRLLCATRTDAEGVYKFEHVPCGTYTLVPLYKRAHTTYEVAPTEQAIVVKHGT